VGKDLIVNDLSTQSDADLASLSRLGGKIIATNANGLAVKVELEQRAREAAAAKIAEANARASETSMALASTLLTGNSGSFESGLQAPVLGTLDGLALRYQSRLATEGGSELMYRGMSAADFAKVQSNQGRFETFGKDGYMSPSLDYIRGMEARTTNPNIDLSVKVEYEMSRDALQRIRDGAFTSNPPADRQFPDNPRLKDKGPLGVEDIFTLKGETVSGRTGGTTVISLPTEGNRVFNLGVGRNVTGDVKDAAFSWRVVESGNPEVPAGTSGFGGRYATPAELSLQSGLGTVGKGLTAVAIASDAYRMGSAISTGDSSKIADTGVNIAGGWAGAYVGSKAGAASFAAAGCLTPLAAVPFVCAASPFVGGLVGGISGYKYGSAAASTAWTAVQKRP
jgi:hypothetical protein